MPEIKSNIQANRIDMDDLALLQQAGAQAGRIAMGYFGRSPETWLKNGHSPVSEADLAVDKYLKQILLDARPDYGWISEETIDDRPVRAYKRAFVVDPIDGTRAYLAGKDVWCVSIAVIEAGLPRCGVLDCPARGEVMSAVKHNGAYLNGEPIVPSRIEAGSAVKIAMARSNLAKMPEPFRHKVIISDYIPSLAYRIAMVARGDLTGTFVRSGAHDWDLAAADLILSEAGGVLLKDDGSPVHYDGDSRRHGALVASVAGFEQEMLSVAGLIPLN